MKKIKRILITAGPTREHLDPVRFITNLSSGRMGYELAQAAVARGYQVSLVSGPTALKTPRGVKFYPVLSAIQMKRICSKLFPLHDGLVMTAAVCDFMPVCPARCKIPSKTGLILKLKRTPDILAGLAKGKGKKFVIGFCLETDHLVQKALAKLKKKNLDGIVANYYAPGRQIPFGEQKIQVILIDKKMKKVKLPVESKSRIARRILHWMEKLRAEG